jgi:signal transduction histidine kinase
LVLNSYGETLGWTNLLNETIVSTLKKEKKGKDTFYITNEFMDTKVFRPTKEREENLLCYYQNKYKGYEFDIIVTTDDNALNFVRKYKDIDIFKKAKVFFAGVNNLSLFNVLDKNIYAGVFESKNPLANLALAKKAVKGLKKIYLITDNSVTAKKVEKLYKSKLSKIDGVEFKYISNKDIEKVIEKIKNYEPKSAMMLLVFGSFYKDGKHLDTNEVPKLLSKYYNNPMIIHSSVFASIPNCNIIGGDCTDANMQGTIAAQKVLEYISGKKMSEIGFRLKDTNKVYLNVKNMQKFGLSVDDFGIKEPILVNVPTSFYELYKNEINLIIAVMAVIIIFSLMLYKKNWELKRYAQEINNLNKSLELKIKKAVEENSKKDKMLFEQSKLAAMGEMIGAIAHQWRQPLNAIGINIQNLEDDYEDGLVDEKFIREFIEKNMNIIHFMSRTIDDFRDFFKVDKDKKIFNIKKAVEDVVNIQSIQFKNHNIDLQIKGEDFSIVGYESEFKQVILNLINNAKDAILENNIPYGIVEIILDGKNKELSIKDNGGGIPEDVIDRVFEPYFTTKEQGKGTGIGLYMSKLIIEDNIGGKLIAKNAGDGAVFTIRFLS